jgi:ABC-2 type transport system permease protein
VNRILVILRKEWIELRQEKMLVFTSLLLPLIFSLAPVIAIAAMRTANPTQLHGLPAGASIDPGLKALSGAALLQAVTGQEFRLLLLLLPAIIPSVISSYSIVGEKTSRTLEPVLATPVTTLQFLLGKSLAAFIPAMILTWLASLIFVVGLWLAAISPQVPAYVVSPAWIMMLLLWAPLLSLITIGLTVRVSSRANDPRSAQQVSALLILPIAAVFAGELSGVLVMGPLMALIGALLLAAAAALVIWLSVNFFQRKTILTRWS